MEQPDENLTYGSAQLRRWRAEDADALERAIGESLDHLLPWMPWAADHRASGRGRQATLDFLARADEEWRAGGAFSYAIVSDRAVIGSCGLMRRIGPGGLEAGYWLHPRWTGRGLAAMAVTAVAGEAFRLAGVDRVEIHHDAANRASGAVARRAGFTEVRRFPCDPTSPGEVGTRVVWRMAADEWGPRRRPGEDAPGEDGDR